MSNATILIIEDHPITAELIQKVITSNRPLCKVLMVETPEAAMAHLKRERVHLVIANLQASSQESFAFMAVLNGWNPSIPIIAIGDGAADRPHSSVGGISVLPNPIDFEVLLELIDTMTLAAQESVLNGISLENFLQMLEQERKTCTLKIISGYQIGHLHLAKGRLVDARTGELRRKEAALAILAWPNCTINISEKTPPQAVMDLEIQSLLMEWCILKDEKVPVH